MARKDGRYEAKGIDPATGRRKSYYSRESQAEADHLARLSLGRRNDQTFYTYYVTAFIPSIVTRSDAWKAQIMWAMDRHWLPVFGGFDIAAIKRQDVQRHFNQLATRLSPKSVRHVLKIVSAVFALAEADEIIERTPCLKIRLPELAEGTKKALTFEQLASLIRSSHPLIRPMALLCGCCGHRPGEALGQTWQGIKAGVLEVRQQVLQERGRVVVKPSLKTPQSHRWVPLPDGLLDALKSCEQVSDVWVCSDTIGGYLLPKNVPRELATACKRAGLVDDWDKPLISMNELRHTFISLMENDLEAPSRIVEQITGKAKKGRTGTYSHAELRQMKRWMDRYWDRVSTELTTSAVVKIG